MAIIGIRGDEPMRVARIKERGQADVSAETIYMPLADAEVGKQEVQRFWAKQDYNLLLPDGPQPVELRLLLHEGRQCSC